MKKITTICLTLLLLLSGGAALVQADFTDFGSIRGTVRIDTDGNGVCTNGAPIANFPVEFTTPDGQNLLKLVTGSNGTYGIVSIAPGAWDVTAVPPSSGWTITSQSPIRVNVTLTDLVTTGIDFCAKSDGSLTNLVEVLADEFVASTSSPFSGFEPPLNIEENYIVSEALLEAEIPVPDYEDLEEFIEEEEVVVVIDEDLSDWLTYVNQFRTMGNLPALTESPLLTNGSLDHARFMVLNDQCCAHSQNINNPLYTAAGYDAAVNGNIFSSSWNGNTMENAMNFWISAPFHLIGIIDPALSEVGYGDYRQDVGVFHMSAVLDVRSNINSGVDVPDSTYPTFFPGNGSETFVVRRSLPEWPEPLEHPTCANFAIPTGPALMMMIGNGDKTPIVTESRILRDGITDVDFCYFTELSYQNPDFYAQLTGRSILDQRDAIVVIPRYPLIGGSTYQVQLTVNGEPYSWEFSVRQ